jgi:hypothetical protein
LELVFLAIERLSFTFYTKKWAFFDWLWKI